MIEFKYRPDVDGLRAVAVLLVLFFHAGLGFPGGFVGVDVFFVISGFLITGLLLKEQQDERFRLSHFWIRRIRRILPVSMFIVITTLIVGFIVLLPSDYEALATSAIAQQLMLSNVYFWRNTGYFGGEADLKPLLHTWSLGVEEQFYIGYPFVIVLLSRFSRKAMLSSLVAISALSFTLSVWGVYRYPSATFYLLPTRAWELLLGGILCFAPKSRHPTSFAPNILSGIGLAGILATALCYTSTTRFPGLAALLPCAATALIIYANTDAVTWVGRFLSAKPVVFVGLISYSLYLWHWPILSFIRHLNCGAKPDLSIRVLALAASVCLASLTLRYIETPFRKRYIFAETKKLLLATASAASLLLLFSTTIIFCEGWPQRFDQRAIAYASAKNSMGFRTEVNVEQVRAGDVPKFGATPDSHHHKCLVWGDSHAMALMSGIDAACKSHHIRGLAACHSATAPMLDCYVMDRFGLSERALDFNQAIVEFAISEQVDVCIIAAVWSTYHKHPDFERGLVNTVLKLKAAGIPVAIVRDVAIFRDDVPLTLSMAVRHGQDVEKIGVPFDEYLKKNDLCHAVFDRLAAANPSLTIIDPSSRFVDEARLWRAEYSGESMYRDYHHLSVQGALRCQLLFEKLFDELSLK